MFREGEVRRRLRREREPAWEEEESECYEELQLGLERVREGEI